LPNQLVNFVVVDGNGSVFAPTVATSANGEAHNQWTIGTIAGLQAIEARTIDQCNGARHRQP
jgi:hypothetical protein